ncbi:MAG: hypothetical protein P4L98_23225 [Ancalomicrobiaceae bacterium]|nr:hypothetical protein [Ancalomicrobiaceae bacterium]
MEAVILPFVSRALPADPNREAPGQAKIIIFTGVRYEHTDRDGVVDEPASDGPRDPVDGGSTTRRHI